MLLKRNRISIGLENLPLMLGEDGTTFLCNIDYLFADVVSLNCIDVKVWLRDVLIHNYLMRVTAELAGRVSLLLECPALQRVDVRVDRVDRGYGSSSLRYTIETLSCAFKALAEKLGRRLTFYLRSLDLNSWKTHFAGDLAQLENLARDEWSNVESEGWGLEY